MREIVLLREISMISCSNTDSKKLIKKIENASKDGQKMKND